LCTCNSMVFNKPTTLNRWIVKMEQSRLLIKKLKVSGAATPLKYHFRQKAGIEA
ncbi:hypothetical protein PanWU01x14_297970, partial [Parasponia andersonii]